VAEQWARKKGVSFNPNWIRLDDEDCLHQEPPQPSQPLPSGPGDMAHNPLQHNRSGSSSTMSTQDAGIVETTTTVVRRYTSTTPLPDLTEISEHPSMSQHTVSQDHESHQSRSHHETEGSRRKALRQLFRI
jgi:hypothetical protein